MEVSVLTMGMQAWTMKVQNQAIVLSQSLSPSHARTFAYYKGNSISLRMVDKNTILMHEGLVIFRAYDW